MQEFHGLYTYQASLKYNTIFQKKTLFVLTPETTSCFSDKWCLVMLKMIVLSKEAQVWHCYKMEVVGEAGSMHRGSCLWQWRPFFTYHLGDLSALSENSHVGRFGSQGQTTSFLVLVWFSQTWCEMTNSTPFKGEPYYHWKGCYHSVFLSTNPIKRQFNKVIVRLSVLSVCVFSFLKSNIYKVNMMLCWTM